jgi:uncharacterized protein (DUF362 family)
VDSSIKSEGPPKPNLPLRTGPASTRVTLRRALTIGEVARAVGEGLDWAGISPAHGDRWVIKLNLTYPEYIPGVVNSPRFVEGLCQWGRDAGVRLNFIEGDGGNGSYSARDAFRANQVEAIAERYGMQLSSLSEEPWEWRDTEVAGQVVRLPYSPFFSRREYDRFVTAPLFKTHVFTRVTLGMKNLWGCIPDGYRMYYHHLLNRGIVALYKELQPDFTIVDGVYGLRGNGPMDGEALPLDVVMVAGSVPAGEIGALVAMGVAEDEVAHLTLARRERLLPMASQLIWSGGAPPQRLGEFTLQRTMLNYASIALSRLPRLQRIVYHSKVSTGIYAVVDRLRPHSAQSRLVEAKRQKRYTTTAFSDAKRKSQP